MEISNVSPAVNLAIALIYAVLMGTAAFDKLKAGKAPDWFLKPFEGTVVSKLPGGAAMGFWLIAFLETALFAGFVLSVLVPGLLPLSLVGSLFLFAILCFGLRVTGEYQGSANMFVYFGATLVALASI